MIRSLRPLLLILAAGLLPVAAQDASGFSGALNLAQGTDAMKQLTGARNGFSLDGAWDSSSQGLPFRVGLSYAKFAEATHTRSQPLDKDGNPQPDVILSGPGLTTFQVYGAMRFDLTKDVRMYFGLTANRHRLTSDLLGQGGSQEVKGFKLGTRVDLEYKITPQWAAVGAFQWMELGNSPSGNQCINPSWFQAGVRYNF